MDRLSVLVRRFAINSLVKCPRKNFLNTYFVLGLEFTETTTRDLVSKSVVVLTLREAYEDFRMWYGMQYSLGFGCPSKTEFEIELSNIIGLMDDGIAGWHGWKLSQESSLETRNTRTMIEFVVACFEIFKVMYEKYPEPTNNALRELWKV